MKLKKKSYIISNKQIAIKRMGTKSNRKKSIMKMIREKQITIKGIKIKIDTKINYKKQN
jgi:hypothetical protein